MELTRRSFLKGTGLAAGVAAIGGLAGCTSSTDNSSATSADSNSEVLYSWEVAPEPIADSNVSETHDCDICIIGAGCAGTPAAFYASLKGYNVVVLQKADAVANNGGGIGVWNYTRGDGASMKWDIPNTMQLFANQTSGKCNFKLARKTIEWSGPVVEWIQDNVPGLTVNTILLDNDHFGVAFDFAEKSDFDDNWARLHYLLGKMADTAEEKSSTFLYSTPCVQLVQDSNGKVTGAIGQTSDGSYVKVNASMGTILCAGDIDNDDDMLAAYSPIALGISKVQYQTTNTGDGLKLGLWAGAKHEQSPANLQIHLSPSSLAATGPLEGVPFLHVNSQGERFMNENMNYPSHCMEIRMQPGQIAYQIKDSHILEHISDYPNTFHPNGTQEALDSAIKSGIAWKADTIEELAEAMGVPADTFIETVKRYNQMVDQASDEDYGVDPTYLVWNGIKDAPFYGIEYKAGLLVSQVGLCCNENFQVLDANDEPIPNLYVAGNNQGSFYGYDYPATGFSGGSCSRAVTGGILAVKAIDGTLDQAI